jgi:Fe-S-cluster containining protein
MAKKTPICALRMLNKRAMKNPRDRRQIILSEMNALDERGVNCASCTGVCCTSFANSMQTTPLETQDVLTYLQASGRWNEELRKKLQATVSKFRLDHSVGNGKRSFIRRTYDCPFFAGGSLGCTIPAEVKPYGCLGFNPSVASSKAGEGCESDQSLLKKQSDVLKEVDHEIGFQWTKLPFPVALLTLSADQ